jgi:peptidoglycan/xylan/chitin deacetylase (PgdA/CDA1 family)
MLRNAKIALLRGMDATGVSTAVAKSRWRNDRLLILCFHGVSLQEEHIWGPYLYHTPELFEARLKALATGGYNVLPLAEGLDLLRRQRLPERAVVITFDDGFADFHLRALPLLKKFGFPVTLYLTTYYVFFNRPIFNLIVPYMLWRNRHTRVAPNTKLGWSRELDLANPDDRDAAWESVRALAESRSMKAQAKDDLAAEVASQLNLDYGAVRAERTLALMTPEEVTAISRGGVGVELHTHRHRVPEDRSLFANEIEENRRRIFELTGTEPRHFCYPSGFYRPEMLPWLAEAGVTSAAASSPGLVTTSTNPLLLPRFLDYQTVPTAVFESWLTGIGDWMKQLQNALGGARV